MWWCRSTREMNRGFVCFLVLGLGSASLAADPAPDSVGSEAKTISAKISSSGSTVNHSPLDKSKRGAAKLSNPENPAFNHLGSANSAGGTNAYRQASGVVAANPPPFKYLYNNQYYQHNPYLTYVHVPPATQIAAQYAFQSNPVAHYLQTPTQIQYVSAPTVAQVPPVKYQSFSNDQYSASGAEAGASAAAASSHYAAPGQQVQASHSYSPAASQASAASAATSQTKQQVQVPLYSGYQSQQQFYYPQQQSFFTFVPQPHISPANFIYQQPNANYYFRQQQQPQYLNFYGGNRFGLYSPTTQSGQLTYLVPMPVAPAVQEQSTSDLKTADKALSGGQHSASANSFAYGTKA